MGVFYLNGPFVSHPSFEKNASRIHVYLPLIPKSCKDVEKFAAVYVCE